MSDGQNKSNQWISQSVSFVMLLASIASILISQISLSRGSYASKDALKAVSEKAEQNAKAIKVLKDSNDNTRWLICGIVMDMKLPTAREECRKLLRR